MCTFYFFCTDGGTYDTIRLFFSVMSLTQKKVLFERAADLFICYLYLGNKSLCFFRQQQQNKDTFQTSLWKPQKALSVPL